MNLYQDYCYSDMTALTNSVQSQPVLMSGNNFVYPVLVSITGNSATFSSSVGNYTRTFTECTTVGPVSSAFHLSTSDSVELAWAVISVWLVAYLIKIMRRTL